MLVGPSFHAQKFAIAPTMKKQEKNIKVELN